MSEYSCRKLESSEFNLLIPLMKDCFGMDVNIDYFKWKYLDNPSGEFIGFIALSETNEVAAYYGVIPQVFTVDGKPQTLFQSCDTMTHSKHRRKGLFQKLALMCYDYIRQNHLFFLIGFGGGQSTPGFLKFGWISLFNVKYYFFSEISAKLNVWRYKPDASINEISVQDAKQMSELFTKPTGQTAIQSYRNIEHFFWRISNPMHHYKIAVLRENDIPSSYLSYYELGDKLVLFCFYFNNKKASQKLINYLKSMMLKRKKKGIIYFAQENSENTQYVRYNNFISNPFNKGPLSMRTPFILYGSEETMNKYKDPGCWNIDSFDHDV